MKLWINQTVIRKFMSLDLYDHYKKFYQRWHRNQDNEELREMKDLAHEIAFFLHKNREKRGKSALRKSLLMAKNLAKLEKSYGHNHLFSYAIVEAISNNNFVINVPPVKMHSWNFDDGKCAYIYVATSLERLGESKLGVTTLDPEIRANKYSAKYGYSISIYRSIEAKNPFEIEADIENELTNFRITKNTVSDSIEWYKISPEKLFSIVLAHIKSNP